MKNPVRRKTKSIKWLSNVHINEFRVKNLAEKIDNLDIEIPKWNDLVFPSDDEEFVNFVLVGNCINFGFNYPENNIKYKTKYKNKNWIGSMGLWATLHRAIEDYDIPIYDYNWLKNLSVEEWINLTDPIDVDMPYSIKRVKCLNSLGEFMDENNITTFKKLFEDYDNLYGNSGLIDFLVESKAYEDFRRYNNDKIRFDRKAQLAIMMAYNRISVHNNKSWGSFEDIDELVISSGSYIPAYLNSTQAIEYNNFLEEEINNQMIIKEDSEKEVEIRLATLKVGEMIKQEIDNINTSKLNYVLFNLAKSNNTVEHITPTNSY